MRDWARLGIVLLGLYFGFNYFVDLLWSLGSTLADPSLTTEEIRRSALLNALPRLGGCLLAGALIALSRPLADGLIGSDSVAARSADSVRDAAVVGVALVGLLTLVEGVVEASLMLAYTNTGSGWGPQLAGPPVRIAIGAGLLASRHGIATYVASTPTGVDA